MVAVLGAPASGKSSLMAELVEDARARGREARVLDPAGNWPDIGEWPELKDDPRSPEEIADAWLLALLADRYHKPGIPPLLLVIDDADTFLDGNKARGPFRRLFTTFRHYRVDVVIGARRTQDLPKIVFTSSTNVYLFRHFVSTDYISKEWGAEVTRAIPKEPFKYALFDVESREIAEGKTKKRIVRTAADG